MGAALNPLFRSTVRGAYKIGQKTKEMLAEAHEQVNDIVAEVHAEGDVDQPRLQADRRIGKLTREPNVPAAALPSISSSRSCARSRSADSQSDSPLLQCRPRQSGQLGANFRLTGSSMR